MRNILIMGAGGTAGINFIESLKHCVGKYYLVGCDINKYHLKLSSVHKSYVVPPATDMSYMQDILDIINKEKIDFIHAQPDIEVETISEYRDRLSCKYLLPSKETIRICRNKWLTYTVLRDTGFKETPLTAKVTYYNLVATEIKNMLRVTNSSKVWLRAAKGSGSKAALPLKSANLAIEWMKYWRQSGRLESPIFTISEFLPGREFAFQSLWYNGKLITSTARERLEYLFGNMMASGQSSSPTVARTVHDDRVNDIATRAIQTIDANATGIFCVDLKENKDRVPCVTEVNAGRFFTTSNFITKAGLNMPEIYVDLGLNGEPLEYSKYNAVAKDLYWIRSVDKEPILWRK